MILLGAEIFSTFFALTQTTQALVGWVGTLQVPSWMIVLALVGIYIVLGCFMDQMAIMVLTVPVVAPIMTSLGFDLIWFGVVMIIVAEIGLVTPPFGLNVFVVAKYSGAPAATVFRGVFPHILSHLAAIAVLLLWPQLSLWLPNHMR